MNVLDFVRLATRAEGPHGVGGGHVRRTKRNESDWTAIGLRFERHLPVAEARAPAPTPALACHRKGQRWHESATRVLVPDPVGVARGCPCVCRSKQTLQLRRHPRSVEPLGTGTVIVTVIVTGTGTFAGLDVGVGVGVGVDTHVQRPLPSMLPKHGMSSFARAARGRALKHIAIGNGRAATTKFG